MILSGNAVIAALAAAITEATQGSRPSAVPDERFDLWNLWRRVVRHFPGDPGIVVASFMNRLSLSAGQALFVPAGIIHAYVEGYGLEVMAPSDNVLRGGLTTKHIDRDELAAIVHAEPSRADVFQPTSPAPGISHFAPPEVPFHVTRVETGSGVHTFNGTGPWVVVVESGTGVVTDGDGRFPVGAGSAYALASEGTAPRLEATGAIYVIGAP
jgi:mannose-6-phosphate isomerase